MVLRLFDDFAMKCFFTLAESICDESSTLLFNELNELARTIRLYLKGQNHWLPSENFPNNNNNRIVY